MPIYEYKCTVCNMSFSEHAGVNDPRPTAGPGCPSGSCSIEKLISRCVGHVAGRNAQMAASEAAGETSARAEAPKSAAHSCSYYCDHG